jgi:hypothetical protein
MAIRHASLAIIVSVMAIPAEDIAGRVSLLAFRPLSSARSEAVMAADVDQSA